MSKHVSISPEEAADRLAIRELVEAYAHCADRRDAKGQMALFTPDTHFVVYMNAKDPKPSQELHSREELAPVFADLNQYAATMHFLGLTAIVRRKLGISHPKLKEVLHQDFANCSALAGPFSGQDAAVFCLGTYTGSVPDAELRKITVDYTIEFARVLHGSSPDAVFSFLSGSGADQTGRSRMAFARYKGEAEKALLGAGFPHVYLFRPADNLALGART